MVLNAKRHAELKKPMSETHPLLATAQNTNSAPVVEMERAEKSNEKITKQAQEDEGVYMEAVQRLVEQQRR